jgi:hypothetical protein
VLARLTKYAVVLSTKEGEFDEAETEVMVGEQSLAGGVKPESDPRTAFGQNVRPTGAFPPVVRRALEPVIGLLCLSL